MPETFLAPPSTGIQVPEWMRPRTQRRYDRRLAAGRDVSRLLRREERWQARHPLRAGLRRTNDLISEWMDQYRNQRGFLGPQFEALLDEGYSPDEQSGILNAALSGIGGAYSGAREDLANRVARTRNRAGYGSRSMELTRAEGREKAQAGFDVRKLFADEKQRRRMMGLEGLMQLYGIDANFLQNLFGMQQQLTGMKLQKKLAKRGALGTVAGVVDILGGIADIFKPKQSGGDG